MSFDPAQHPRDTSGQFSEKIGTSPELALAPAIKFQQSPLSESDVEDFTGGDCNHLAHRLHERLGWEPVIITTDGHGWTHVGVRSPEGYVIDAEGISDGEHILNSDEYLDNFSDDELEASDGEVFLAEMPSAERDFIAKEYETYEDRERVERVAEQLVAWVDALGVRR
jgi:hypothetical protein